MKDIKKNILAVTISRYSRKRPERLFSTNIKLRWCDKIANENTIRARPKNPSNWGQWLINTTYEENIKISWKNLNSSDRYKIETQVTQTRELTGVWHRPKTKKTSDLRVLVQSH